MKQSVNTLKDMILSKLVKTIPNMLLKSIRKGLEKQVPATGLGLFRICFGLVIFQEIVFLFYFRHLIFDPLPFIEPASIWISITLVLWGIAVFFLIVGCFTYYAAIANYIFWIGFVAFTPMLREFDGGFDQLMTGSSFLLIFLPSQRALSIDNLRLKLKHSMPARHYHPRRQVSLLSYYIPIAISLGLLYFDSGVHKLSAEFWRNGMGAWLPSTMPYYISAIDMTWLLNLKPVQMLIGYSIIAFEFIFIFLCYFRRFRTPLLIYGAALHIGIIVSLNIYPFGFGMLVHYSLMAPFRWWRILGKKLRLNQPALSVFYDQLCPLCNRTVIIVKHFDLLKAIEFKGLQDHARSHPELNRVDDCELLKDLYALNRNGQLFQGLDTYINILLGMKYPALLGHILKIPGIYHLGNKVYRKIADGRARLVCGDACLALEEKPLNNLEPFAGYTNRQRSRILTGFLMLMLVLQLNSTLRFGILHRLDIHPALTKYSHIFKPISDAAMAFSHLFLGISPHALYMHDHFAGYERIFAITYVDTNGNEQWLPLVNQEGRLIAPNWGRVHSMWANVAITPKIRPERMNKFITKVTAFWGAKLRIDLADAEFRLKMKQIHLPMQWEKDLRNRNLNQPWRDIGKAVWTDYSMTVYLRRNINDPADSLARGL